MTPGASVLGSVLSIALLAWVWLTLAARWDRYAGRTRPATAPDAPPATVEAPGPARNGRHLGHAHDWRIDETRPGGVVVRRCQTDTCRAVEVDGRIRADA